MMPTQGNCGLGRQRGAEGVMGTDRGDTDLYPPDRVERAAAAAAEAGLAALLLTPGPDLRYLTGYDAHQLERLTCLAVPAASSPHDSVLLVPALEYPAAEAS